MRFVTGCLGAIALSVLAAGTPASACSPIMPGFAALAQEPMQAVVVGRFVPKPGGQNDSSLFEVERVLHGNLEPGRYHLVMSGPWGSMCEVYAMESSGPVAPAENPVVLLVAKRIGTKGLDVPFGTERARLYNGRLETKI